MILPMRSSSRVLLFAAVLVLPSALASAGDEPTCIPLFSWADGSSAHIEISRAGERSKAVPVLEIPDVAVPHGSGTDRIRSGRPEGPSAGTDGEEGKERAVAGGYDGHLRSLFVREGPEGVSLGNAFDLVGDVQEAVKKFRNRRTTEGFASSGNDDDADRPPVSAKGNLAENRGANDPGDLRCRVQ